MLGGSHLLGIGMHSGQLVFAHVMTYLPLKAFSRMVLARRAQHKVKDFSCLDQFLADSASDLHRSRNWQDTGVPDEQHDAFAVDHLRTLHTALAGRVVLQMDQTASA